MAMLREMSPRMIPLSHHAASTMSPCRERLRNGAVVNIADTELRATDTDDAAGARAGDFAVRATASSGRRPGGSGWVRGCCGGNS